MYEIPKSTKDKGEEKVRLSFSSWMLGGPLVKPPKKSDHVRNRSTGNKKLEYVLKSGEKSMTTGAKPSTEVEMISKAAKEEPAKPDEVEKTEEKPEEKKGDPKPTQSKVSTDVKEFTAEQDADISNLQKEGKTWREIAKVVKRGQKDCQARFEELQKAEKEEDSLPPVEEAPDVIEVVAKEDSEKAGATKKDVAKNLKQKDKKNSTKNPQQTDKKKHIRKVSFEIEEADRKKLKPDEIWTKSDCETLEMLKGRYEDQKWLQIQAAFYNFTGRMVISDFIEKKFREG